MHYPEAAQAGCIGGFTGMATEIIEPRRLWVAGRLVPSLTPA